MPIAALLAAGLPELLKLAAALTQHLLAEGAISQGDADAMWVGSRDDWKDEWDKWVKQQANK